MATSIPTAGCGGNTVLVRAQALVPAALFDTVLGSDFDNSAWYATSLGGTGAVALSQTAKGGVVSLTTGGTGGGSAVIKAAGFPTLIDNTKTSPWYLYGRFQIGAMNANASCDMELDGVAAGVLANPVFQIGGLGAISTTNFAWSVTNSGGTSIASGTGPVLDTNFHTFEIVSDATTVTFYLDGVSIGTTPATNGGAQPGTPVLVTVNGATAAARTLNADKLWFVCQGN